MPKNYSILDLEEHGRGHSSGPVSTVGQQTKTKSLNRPLPVHFEDALVDNFHLKKPRNAGDVLISALGHAFIVALIILLPLCYTHAIDLPQLEKTLLIAPPPPPPPGAGPHIIHSRLKSFFAQGKLLAPQSIPKQIAQIKEEAPNAEPSFGGFTGGVPGGIPGGQLGGVLGGILGGNRQIVPPPPPPPARARTGPYRVGGKVQAPRLIHSVQPVFPILAKQARIQGTVQIDSVIDERGNVTQMRVVTGNPLLVPAAFDAVKEWKYQPTLLNGTPISVEMVVTVQFVLGN
jgi:protein TonB